jgi:F0F1-type ATP synthase assembly protein I
MIATHKTYYRKQQELSGIMMLSAWGFAMVTASFLFLWVGLKLDELMGTTPNFMLGLFFLAIFICVMRLYREAKIKMKEI